MKKPKQASWRTLMRQASKAKTPAEAKRLRDMAAEQRRAKRAKKTIPPLYKKHEESFKSKAIVRKRIPKLPTDQERLDFKTSMSGGDKLTISRWDNAEVVELKKIAQRLEGELATVGGKSKAPQFEADLETEKKIVHSLERLLVYRDQQLIDEFISGVADLRRCGPGPDVNPNFLKVPNSQIDAILKALTRK